MSRASLDQAVYLACPLVIREDIEVVSLSDDQAVSYKLDKKTGGNGIIGVCITLQITCLLCTIIIVYSCNNTGSAMYVLHTFSLAMPISTVVSCPLAS